MSMELYVGNLSFKTSNGELVRLFSQTGTVESAKIITTLMGNPCGFGFVEMSSRSEGAAAIAKFHGEKVNGRCLTVNESLPPLTRAAGAYSGGNGDYSRESYANSRLTGW